MGVRDESNIRPVSLNRQFPAGVTRYDLILALIPLAFVVAFFVASVASIPPHMAIIGGALVGAIVLSDALFVHPPTDRHSGDLRR